MAYREYYVCAAEGMSVATAGANNKIECVAIAEGECFFTDVDRSLCKYIPGDGAKKTVFEWKYPGYTIGTTAYAQQQNPVAAVGGMKP